MGAAHALSSTGLMAHVQSLARTVEVPRSVPGLATQRLLVMSFVEGDQITRLEHRTRDLSARWASVPCRPYLSQLQYSKLGSSESLALREDNASALQIVVISVKEEAFGKAADHG